jgi:hypothetical protein
LFSVGDALIASDIYYACKEKKMSMLVYLLRVTFYFKNIL